MTIPAALRRMDIMLVDQLLRGRIPPTARVLDIGCGQGRNLRWFQEQGHQVLGCDPAADAIAACQAAGLPAEQRALPDLGLPQQAFDLVILNAVLHFAPDATRFVRWFQAAAIPLAPGGMLFIRCASRLAWPGPLPCDSSGRIPPGVHGFRFLADRQQIEDCRVRAGLDWDEPPKTSVVHDSRCMSTLVLRRPETPSA